MLFCELSGRSSTYWRERDPMLQSTARETWGRTVLILLILQGIIDSEHYYPSIVQEVVSKGFGNHATRESGSQLIQLGELAEMTEIS